MSALRSDIRVNPIVLTLVAIWVFVFSMAPVFSFFVLSLVNQHPVEYKLTVLDREGGQHEVTLVCVTEGRDCDVIED